MMMTILDPITFSYPTVFEDDGVIVSFIGNTQADDKGIGVEVWRWTEPGEPVRIAMNLDLTAATDAAEATIELNLPKAQELRQALRGKDRGMRWMLDYAMSHVPEGSKVWMARIAGEASYYDDVNAKLRDLVDGALIAMNEHAQIPA